MILSTTARLTEQYNEFVRKMWVENCIERDIYREKNLSHIEYAVNYRAYLEENFYSTLGENMVWSAEKADYVVT